MEKTDKQTPFLFAHPYLAAFIIFLGTETSMILMFWEDSIRFFQEKPVLVSIGTYLLKYLVYLAVVLISVFLWKRKQS
ncbi:MAG: hypothetical protein D6794_00595 [Deltaproteobacteria bacterium]|nr:MAG: hypothetical protein D6794_00595 [Deltaproteobacteria bacterium]